MSALSSSLTFIGPWPEHLSRVSGFHVFNRWSDAQNSLIKFQPPIIGLGLTTLLEKGFQKFLLEFSQKNPNLVLVLVAPKEIPVKDLSLLRRQYPIAYILHHFDDPQLQTILHQAMEIHRWKGHFNELRRMRENHSDRLSKVQAELKTRIEKRELTLLASRDKVVEQNRWTESLSQVIAAAVKAMDLDDLNLTIKSSLYSVIDGQVSIVTGEINTTDYVWHEALLSPDGKKLGYLTVSQANEKTPTKKKLSAKEKKFLHEIGEFLAFTLVRLQREAQHEQLRTEWDETFKAIDHPLVLLDEDYNVIQANRSSQGTASGSTKCYTLLFGRNEVCEGCQRGTTFSLEGESNEGKEKLITVRGQKLTNLSHGNGYLHVYEDVTEKKKMEETILMSSTLAEMGTVAGSIAHELNNPLAGIISFLQLMKSDLDPSDLHLEDVKEMEAAALKSKKIIEGLLDFVRIPLNPHKDDRLK